jgi:hypothetical protein
MSTSKTPLSLTFISLSLSLGLVVAPGLQTSVNAQLDTVNQASNPLTESSVLRVTFDPQGAGKPKDSAGGASRDGNGCSQPNAEQSTCVTPLMPSNYGLTLAERPSFLIYIPETSAKQMFFSLVDENNQNLYQAKLPVTQTSGIVSVQLPADAPALEVGKTYKWTFIMLDERGLRPDSPGVQGMIQRVAPDAQLQQQLANASLLEQAVLYGQAGIWVDTINTMAQLRESQPNDVALNDNWQELLTTVGLKDIATKPLL